MLVRGKDRFGTFGRATDRRAVPEAYQNQTRLMAQYRGRRDAGNKSDAT